MLGLFSKYKILKSFVYGETIQFKVNDEPRSGVFQNVNPSALFILNDQNQEEEIPLNSITTITL